MNPILKIHNHSNFQIPVYFSDDEKKSYLFQLKIKFNTVIKHLNKLDESYYRPSSKESVIERLKNIHFLLIDVLNQYLNGSPATAYEGFKRMLEELKLNDEIRSLQQHKITKETLFFRTQKQWETVPLKKRGKKGLINFKQPNEIFHTPFQKRRSVNTNRFSISGYPCLYLSESILTSFSECFPERKDFDLFHAVSFKNIRPLYFIDLSENKLLRKLDLFKGLKANGKKEEEEVSSLLDSLGVYQLVIATHTKIKYKEQYRGEKFYFKAEYIIPQLLLQWLKLEGFAIDGVRYKSCTGEKKFPMLANHFNYVLPVRSNIEAGLCPTLLSIFFSSKVYSYLDKTKPKVIKTALKNISNELTNCDFTSIY